MISATVQTLSEEIDDEKHVVREVILTQVQKLLYTVKEIDDLAKRIPRDVQDDPTVRRGLDYFDIVREALKGLVAFLESPLGQATTDILWRHMREVRNFVEVAASVVIATFFVVVGQEFLDSKDDEFDSVRNSIEKSITFVNNKLEDIESRVNDAAEKLQRIGHGQYKDQEDLKKLLWDFGENVRLAKLDINECESELNDANQKIDSAVKKITARLVLNGVFRGSSIAVGILMVYFLVKRNVLNPYVGTVIGIVSTSFALSSKLPRSRKLYDDFMGYRNAQENLQKLLMRMKARLESHESKQMTINNDI